MRSIFPVLLALVAIPAGCAEPSADVPNEREAAGAPLPPDGIVSAAPVTIDELVSAYDENEAAAQLKYGKQWLSVTGVVESIDLDSDDKPIIRFEGDVFPSPNARLASQFEGDAVELKKRHKATLICSKVSESLGSPRLEDCQLLRDDMVEDKGQLGMAQSK